MDTVVRASRWPRWLTRASLREEQPPLFTVASVHAAHADFVWASLQRLGIRSPDLEDLLQEVFLVVHQRLHTFDRSGPITAWLFGICRRVAAAHRRRAYVKNERAAAEDLDLEAEDENADPERAAAERQARARLERVLEALDGDKRAVFVMFEIEGLPCEEIGDLLGIPVGTVYSRLHAARKAFEKALAREIKREGRSDGA